MQFPSQFSKAEQLRLWVPDGSPHRFDYSDGESTERYLEESVATASDVSSSSLELVSKIIDWPSDYHFSPERASLLRPLNLAHVTSVLELGAGCGAVTRYLGESVPRVVAVEGSTQRARIAALRCRDLPNVDVVVSNFQDLQLDSKFDIVTLLGVLEYSGKYLRLPDPYLGALELARSHLNDDGILILAIENKLGLKYFAGSSEDHSAIVFDGIEGYISGSPVRTFGKRELERLLGAAGFSAFEFMYPFPDYKLPNAVFRWDDSLADSSSPVLHNWLSVKNSRDYSGKGLMLFDEHLAFRELELNGLLPELSNSFLVVAAKENGHLRKILDSDWLVERITASRKPRYSTRKRLVKSEQGLEVQNALLVEPAAARDKQKPDIELTHHIHARRDYTVGCSLSEMLLKALRQEQTSKNEYVKSVLGSWYQFLLSRATAGTGDDLILPGDWVDAIPSNLILRPDGQVSYIDTEWAYQERLPLAYIFFRGLLITYSELGPWIAGWLRPVLPDLNAKSFIEYCFEMIAVKLTGEDFQKYLYLEWAFQQEVFLRQLPPFAQYLQRVCTPGAEQLPIKQILDEKDSRLLQMEIELTAARGSIAAIQQTKMWKLRNAYARLRCCLSGAHKQG